jgi:hypothetical protein
VRLAGTGAGRWLHGLGIAAKLAANVGHGLGHGPIGSAIAAWSAVALVDEAPAAVLRIDPLHARAADEFGDEVAAGRTPSIRIIRARLHVGQPRTQRVQAHLGSLIDVGEVEETESR